MAVLRYLNRSSINSLVDVWRNYGTNAAAITALYYGGMVSSHQKLLSYHWGFEPDQQFSFKIGRIPVAKITKTELFPFEVKGDHAVYGYLSGSWDKMVMDFEETDVYRSLEMRFVEKVDWDSTPIYQRAVKKIQNGKKSWNSCGSEKELQMRCSKIDALYEDMKLNGYSTQISGKNGPSIRGAPVPDEPRIAVGSDGTIIRCECGRHRIAIAKILGIETVPAVVQIVHDEWGGEFDLFGSDESL